MKNNLPASDAPRVPVENALLQLSQAEPRRDLKAHVRAAVYSPTRQPSRPPWPWLLALVTAAAVILVAFRCWPTVRNHATTAENGSSQAMAEPIAPCDDYRILKADAAALIVQSMQDFSIQHKTLPCQLSTFTISAAPDNQLNCQTAGKSMAVAVTDWNHRVESELTAECRRYLQTGYTVQHRDLERLAQLSASGIPAAADVLLQLANPQHTCHAAAAQLLGAANKLQQIQNAAAWARRARIPPAGHSIPGANQVAAGLCATPTTGK